MPISPTDLVIALVVTVIGAFVQGSIGFGFGILSVPILSLVDPAMAPVPQLLLAMPLTLAMAWRERSHIDVKGVTWLFAGRVPGALIGLWVLGLAAQRSIDIGIALSVVVAVGILGTGVSLPRNRVSEFGTGIIAGTMGMVASMSGPPAALLFKDAKGPIIRASLSLFFAGGLILTAVFRIMAGRMVGDDVVIALLLLPGLFVGYRLSSRFRHKFDGRAIRPAILGISSIAAVGLLVRALGS